MKWAIFTYKFRNIDRPLLLISFAFNWLFSKARPLSLRYKSLLILKNNNVFNMTYSLGHILELYNVSVQTSLNKCQEM